MPTQLQIRRGTSTEHNSFTGAAGELTVDTTKDTVVVHDGSTAGGFPLARANGSNLSGNLNVGTVTATSLDISGDIDVDGTTNLDATNIVGALDVTGSVTAKGASGGNLFLTSTDTSGATGEVLGDINFVSSDASGGSSGTMAKIISLFDSNGDNAAIKIQTGFSTGSGSPTLRDRALFASNGDVSMYEDTGATPKLVWKSSDERLGLGTASPAQKLHIYDATAANQAVRLGNPTSAGTYGEIQYDPSGFEHLYIKAKGTTTGYGNIVFQTGGTPTTALTLNAAGAATFSGEVLIPEKLTHTGDTDTYLKFAGPNDLRLYSGGVEHAAFDGTIVFNQSGSSTMDFRVESDTQDYMLFVDASLNRIGIANASPATALDVNGAVTSAGLHSTTAGTANFIAGANAGNSIVSGGSYNTVVGDNAGTAITEGDFNTALGYGALIADTKGARSVAVGYRALASQNFATATNNFNIGIGHNAGTGILTGIENVLIGGRTGESITTGNYNVIVGNQSASTAVDAVKAQGFGFSLACAAGYTTIGSGSDDIRAAHGNVTWATVSDERYKKDIADSEAGLSLINALRPRTFKYKTLGELPETFNAFEADSTEVFKNSDTNHGFIAQEVKAAIDADDSIKDGFRLWDDRDDGSQEVAEAALIPVLVKAIQELTARIETLEG